jgi:MOB kinase activator 1
MSSAPHGLIESVQIRDLRESVRLPVGENINEWYAQHVHYFHKQLSWLFPIIAEFCTPQNCPQMTAGGGFKYLWEDDDQRRRTALCAPDYITTLLTWVKRQLEDESLFPTAPSAPFPENFEEIVRRIMRRLFRIYAHAYYHHQENFHVLGTMASLNTSFGHFVLFINEFRLVDRDQLDPLSGLISVILRK